MATLKICNKCSIEKDVSNFTINVRRKDGLSSFCKGCASLIYVKNKFNIVQYQKENKIKIREQKELYWKNNKEKLNNKQKDFYRKNKSKLNEVGRDYYNKHSEELKLYQKQYREQNPDKIRSVHRKSYQVQKTKPEYKLRKNCSRTIYSFFKKKNIGKRGLSILKFLPYTIQELKEHLEKQFEPWMTWNNYGTYRTNVWDDNDSSTWTWQIDHIIPHSTFNYTSMADEKFQDCWRLDNLRPLSAKQNFIDGIMRVRHK